MSTTDPRYNTPAWRKLRRWVLDRDRNECQIRGRNCTRWATDADHIDPVVDGGAFFDPANLRAACKKCNGGRGAEHTNRRRYRTTQARYETRL